MERVTQDRRRRWTGCLILCSEAAPLLPGRGTSPTQEFLPTLSRTYFTFSSPSGPAHASLLIGDLLPGPLGRSARWKTEAHVSCWVSIVTDILRMQRHYASWSYLKASTPSNPRCIAGRLDRCSCSMRAPGPCVAHLHGAFLIIADRV